MRHEKDSSYNFSFPKKYRINSKLVFEKLIAHNQTVFLYPFKCYYLFSTLEDGQEVNSMAITVPKRNFKRAVDRNRMKRVTREVYRINHHQILDRKTVVKNKKLSLLFIYIATKKENFVFMEMKMQEILKKIIQIEEQKP